MIRDSVKIISSVSGIDIIINTEVWDIRTFKLLNTINSLDNCLLKYNNSRDVMFGCKYSSTSTSWQRCSLKRVPRSHLI